MPRQQLCALARAVDRRQAKWRAPAQDVVQRGRIAAGAALKEGQHDKSKYGSEHFDKLWTLDVRPTPSALTFFDLQAPIRKVVPEWDQLETTSVDKVGMFVGARDRSLGSLSQKPCLHRCCTTGQERLEV